MEGNHPNDADARSERPKISQTKRRPIFIGEQLEQTIAAAHEPFRTLFVLAALTGARVSELCGLTWGNVRIDDLETAEIEFGWQVDRYGNRHRRRPTAPHELSRSPENSQSCLVGTSSQRGTARRPTSYSLREPAGPCSSGMSRVLSEMRSGGQQTRLDSGPSRFFVRWTPTAGPSKFSAECCLRCTRSGTPSPLAHCSPVKVSTRWLFCSAIGTAPLHGPSMYER